MSRGPDPYQVRELRGFALEWRKQHHDVLIQEEAIVTARDRLEWATKARDKAQSELLAKLHAIDCAAKGNAGWEGRITWMLGELASYGDAKPTEEPTS